MNSFTGEYRYSLDPKNRVFVPVRWRTLLAEEKSEYFILSQGVERCLLLYLPSKWDRLLEDPAIAQMTDKRLQALVLEGIQSNAREAPVDEQGRILIPEPFREHAGLSKDVVIAGSGHRAAIWEPRAWETRRRAAQAAILKLSKKLPL